MDAAPLYPQHWHPIVDTRKRDMSATAEHLTRTQKPVKYYFIDFGISRQFTADDPEPMADPIQGGDRTVPEFEVSDEPCNPFPTDVYYAGNLIRQDFISASVHLVVRRNANKLGRDGQIPRPLTGTDAV